MPGLTTPIAATARLATAPVGAAFAQTTTPPPIQSAPQISAQLKPAATIMAKVSPLTLGTGYRTWNSPTSTASNSSSASPPTAIAALSS
jgi:hypothetical protein